MADFTDKSAEFYKPFADSSQDWEWWRGLDDSLIYVSPSSEQITGYKSQEFHQNQHLFFSIIHPEDTANVKEHFARVLTDPNQAQHEFRIIHRDGRIRWIRHNCFAAYDENGKMVGRRSINRDITEIKELQDQLLESNRRLAEALDAAQVGAWNLDINSGRFSIQGEGFLNSDICGRIDDVYFPSVAPEDIERVSAAIRYSIENKTPFQEDFRLSLPDGRQKWVRCKSGYIDENGAPKMVGLIWDISERKKTEHEILGLRDQLTELAQFPLNNPNIVLRISCDGKLIFMNPAAERESSLLHLEIGQDVGKPFRSGIVKATETGQTIEEVCQFDGKCIWLTYKSDAKGINVYGRDYTERRKIELRLGLLSQMAGKLLKSDNPKILSRELCTEAMKYLDCDLYLHFLADEIEGKLRLNACEGISREHLERVKTINYGTHICGTCAKEHRAVIAQVVQERDEPEVSLIKSCGITCYACFPMIAPGNNLLGTLSFGSSRRSRFTEDELAFMESVADLLATALFRIQAEQSLRDSRRDLSHAQSIAHIGSWRLNLSYGELIWSDETYRIFEIPIGTPMTYEKFLLSVHAEDRAIVSEKWQAALKGDTYICEHRIIAGGHVKWVREKAELELGPEGQLVSGFGTVQDITRQRQDQELLLQTQQNLYNSNQLLQKVLDNTHVLVACMDRDFNFIQVNKAYAEADHHEVSFFAGKNHFDLYPNAENEMIFKQVAQTGQPCMIYARPFVYEGHPERGITYWDWSLSPILDDHGRVAQLVLTLADVTAQIKSQQANERNINRQTSLVKASEEILAADNTDSLLQTISRTAATITLSRIAVAESIHEKGVFSSVSEGNLIMPHLVSKEYKTIFMEGILKELFDTGQTMCFTEEQLRIHPHYTDMPEQHQQVRGLLATPLFNRSGEVNGFIAVSDKLSGDFTAEDESELKKLAAISSLALQHLEARNLLASERDLLEKRIMERTEDLQKAKNDLEKTVSTLGEEVIQRMKVESDLQATNIELARRAERLAKMASELTITEHRERNRIAQILHDHLQQLLVAAKLELSTVLNKIAFGEQRKIIEDVLGNLKDCIEASRSLTVELYPPVMYRSGLTGGLEWLARWMYEKHAFTVELDLREDANTQREDICILLFQSIRELLFNTVKHSGVKCARLELRRKGDFLKITLRDEGKGFDIKKMSEPQSDLSRGFGLFSIRERLISIGGKLEIESEPGRGCTFTLTAPADVSIKTEELATSSRRRIESVSSGQIATGGQKSRIQIMLVDDHTVMRRGLATLLRQEPDMQVVGEASNGEEAVELARRLKPEMILMDYSLPGMSGADATRIICGELSDVRVIGLSMFDEQDRAAAMFEAGACAYASKSESPAILLAAIRTAAATIRGQKKLQRDS